MNKELCQICKTRIAEHHFTRVIEGVSKTYALCSHCKAVMDTRYRELQESARLKAVPVQSRVCPTCGRRLQDFLDSGMLGCSGCYNTFDDYLTEYIRTYHGAVTHVGMDAATPKPVDVEELYKQLKVAVENKDYEMAAAIKKQIDASWEK